MVEVDSNVILRLRWIPYRRGCTTYFAVLPGGDDKVNPLVRQGLEITDRGRPVHEILPSLDDRFEKAFCPLMALRRSGGGIG